jgi:aminoglycoside phosphotransferase (APT) family kinase protein
MPEWDAEISVDATLARTLIADQFPELSDLPIAVLAEGWDNVVYLVGAGWVFRFPRRAIAISGIELEMAVLPELAPLVPLPVPVPVFFGRPSAEFAWPFFGARFIEGREAADAPLTDAGRSALAQPLAGFLRALHRPRVAEAFRDRLPVDPMGRGDMMRRVPHALERLTALESLGTWERPMLAGQLLEQAARLPATDPVAVVHGDLHFRHLLLEGDRLSGVIDWGDVNFGDPAVDLQVFWSFLPVAAREPFMAFYGPISEASLLRARVVAMSLCAVLAIYGNQEGMGSVEREALAGLDRTLS